jgi:hypothetical protein
VSEASCGTTSSFFHTSCTTTTATVLHCATRNSSKLQSMIYYSPEWQLPTGELYQLTTKTGDPSDCIPNGVVVMGKIATISKPSWIAYNYYRHHFNIPIKHN